MASRRTILITGASSGIGAAIAARYAAPGIHLSLWGRDNARLSDVAARAQASGASVSVTALDLADAARVVGLLEAEDDARPIDVAILAAGRGGTRAAGEVTEDPMEVMRVAAVNFAAPVAMASALAGRMAARGAGRIALIGSAAAFFPLPQAPAYSASKAGLAMFADALRLSVARHGVAVTLVSPGFIDTPMSQGLGRARPFLVSADRAAVLVMAAVERRAAHAIFPRPFALLPLLSWATPAWLRNRLLARL